MAADESAVKEYLAIFVKSAGYLYRAALCHAGDGPGAARMLEEALWTVFQREGVVYKRPAFRSEVVGEMELKNGGADWPRLTVEGSRAAAEYSRLDAPLQRAVTACAEFGWPVKDAARSAGVSGKDVRAALDRIRDREGGDEFRKALHAALLKCPAPDVRGLLRAFENRAREYREPNRLLTRVFGGLVFVLGSLLACVVIWVFIILWEKR